MRCEIEYDELRAEREALLAERKRCRERFAAVCRAGLNGAICYVRQRAGEQGAAWEERLVSEMCRLWDARRFSELFRTCLRLVHTRRRTQNATLQCGTFFASTMASASSCSWFDLASEGSPSTSTPLPQAAASRVSPVWPARAVNATG